MATPKTPYGSHWGSNPSPRTKKYYKKVVQVITTNRKELSQGDLYKMERFRNQNSQDLESFKLKAAQDTEMKDSTETARHEEHLRRLEAKGIPIVGKNKRTFDEIMEDKYQKQGRSWKNCAEDISKKARLELDRSTRSQEEEGEERSQVLAGVVLLVAKKLHSQSGDLHRIVESLGGSISWSLAPSVTHFVFQGRNNDLTKEFRLAKAQRCKIVSPDWVYFCRDEQERVEESTFPHTFNPKMKLNLTQDSSLSVSKLSRPRTAKPKMSIEEKIEEEQKDLDDSVLAEDPEEVSAAHKVEDPEVNEMTTELASLSSLLGNVNQTPVS